jgi:hypothetical protein
LLSFWRVSLPLREQFRGNASLDLPPFA